MIKYENEPLKIEIPVPNGTYEVKVTVHADEDIEFTIYSQTRRVMAQDAKMRQGEVRDFDLTVSVCDRSFFEKEPEIFNGVEIYIACDGGLRATASVSPAEIPTIYICGDSTVTDQPAQYPYNPKSTYCGWGQMLPQFLDNKLAVENQAQSGSSTKVFIENNWNAFKDKIKKGDVLIVEFGHNDQKIEELDPFGGYSKNLRYFINYARELGAYPILHSPINRILFQEDGTLLNLLGDYRNAVKKVCEEMDVPFIDLWKRTTDYFVTAGCVKSWGFFFGDENGRDATHTNDIGANLIAKFVMQEMLKQKVEPIYTHIKAELIDTEQVYADPDDKMDMSKELAHIKTVGLVNMPSTLQDIDADITKLQ